MNVEIQIDTSYIDPKIIIITASINEKVNGIVKKLSEETPQMLSGIRDGVVKILDKDDIIKIYAESGKTVAVTAEGEYIVRRRLYELEELLIGDSFARISNSEIINLKKVISFDMSFSGTICVKLSDGASTYVSRRYVSKIKKILGV